MMIVQGFQGNYFRKRVAKEQCKILDHDWRLDRDVTIDEDGELRTTRTYASCKRCGRKEGLDKIPHQAYAKIVGEEIIT